MNSLLNLDYQKDRKKITFFAIAVAVISFLIVFCPFFIRGNSFVWYIDGTKQHATFLEYFSTTGWLANIGKFDFNIGLGEDYFFSFAYYMILDPFILFYLMFFKVNELLAYSLMVSMKIFVIFGVMFFYLKHKNVRPFVAIIISMCYILSGVTLFSVPRHPMFATGLIYLPLMIWGIENILDGKRPYLFIISIVLCTLSNYYQFIISAIISVLYAMCFYFNRIKTQNIKFNFKNFFLAMLKLFCFALLALGICAFMLLPVGYGMLNSARGSSKGVMPLSINWLSSVLVGFLAVSSTPNYCTIGLNLFIVFLSLHFITYLKNEYKSLLIILFVSAFLPVVGYILNIFNYSSGRWLFALDFVCLVCSGFGLDNLLKENVEHSKTHKWFIGFILFAVDIGLLYLLGLLLIKFDLNYILSLVIILLATACLVYLTILIMKKINIKKAYKFNAKIFISLFLVTSITLPLIYTIVYSKQFDDGTIYYGLISSDEQYVSNANNGSFYRVETGRLTGENNYNNRSLNNNYMSTYSYNSCSNGNIYEFLVSNSLSSDIVTLGIAGFDNRIAYQSLFNVNYYLASDSLIPYGYTKVDGTENVYQNSNALPFGTVFHNAITESEFNAVNLSEKGNLMLEAIVLEDDKITNEEHSYTPCTNIIDSTSTLKNCRIEDNKIIADGNATITYSLSNIINSEIYLNLENFRYNFNTNSEKLNRLVNGVGSRTIQIKAEDRVLSITFNDKGSSHYTGNNDYLFNMGYYEDGNASIEISLLKGEYLFDSINLYSYDMSTFQNNIDELKDEHLELDNFKNFDGNNLMGTINLQEDGYLFLSIPYSAGWTAYVDGEKVEILKANIGFMALNLSAGEHKIELVYKTPLLKVGYIISGVCIVGFVATTLFIEVKKFRKKKSNNLNDI